MNSPPAQPFPAGSGVDPGVGPTTLHRGVADRLAAAKLWLVSEAPKVRPSAGGAAATDPPVDLAYLATAVYALVAVPSSEVKRLAADEHWRLYVNEEWAIEADVPEIGREIAHLTWHLLMGHADRARSLFVDRHTAADWALATDLTVDHTLGGEGATPAAVRYAVTADAALTVLKKLGAGRSSEEYFAALSGLPSPPPEVASGASDAADPSSDPDADSPDLPGCGSACDGIPRSHDLPIDADSPAVDVVDADRIRRAVAIDYERHITSRGHTPGEALRWARSITEPQIPWEPILNRAVRRAVGWTSGRSEYTWSRPSRRQAAMPQVRLPGTRRPVPRVSVVIDTSASVDDHLLGTAVGEVMGALSSLGIAGAGITVYSCDVAVGAITHVRRMDDIRLTGGGGTDMRVAFTRIDADRPRPDVVVVLTDGYTPWPQTPPVAAACVVGLLARRGDPLPPTPHWAVRVECRRD